MSLDSSSHDPRGHYWCSIDDDKNLEFHCEIVRAGAGFRLSKVSGAERIRGELNVENDELVFSGERYCLWENCTAKLNGRFKPTGSGQYKGTFKEAPLVVRLAPMPVGAMGGGGYGGVDTSGPIER